MSQLTKGLLSGDSSGRLVVHQAYVTPAVRAWDYKGASTLDDPYVIRPIDDDARDPTRLPQGIKWGIVVVISFNALAVSFVSSAMTGKSYVSQLDQSRGAPSLRSDLKVSLVRPFMLLIREPIVLGLGIYMSVIYSTL